MPLHQWQGKPIVHLDHHDDLEAASAAHEFGSARLDRKGAETAAYEGYRRKLHSEAVAHHLAGMRAAVSCGAQDEGERHNAFYGMHMKALGLKPGSMPPEGSSSTSFESFQKFKPHPADQLLLNGSMTKSEREDFFKSADTDAAYLSEPDADPELSKSLRSPVSLDQLHGQKVKVYFNLHNRLFSIQHNGRVVAHLPDVSLKDVSFNVQEAGRQRVLAEQRKNVHAYVAGTFQHDAEGKKAELLTQGVKYNPYKYEKFVRVHDETPIHGASAAVLRNTPHPLITVEEKPEQVAQDPSWIAEKKTR